MDEVLAAVVAAEVRAEMARQQVTQQPVADAMGMSRQAFNRRITGEIPFDVRELELIARFLRVSVSQFIRGGVAA